jgi:hypothetical protein
MPADRISTTGLASQCLTEPPVRIELTTFSLRESVIEDGISGYQRIGGALRVANAMWRHDGHEVGTRQARVRMSKIGLP